MFRSYFEPSDFPRDGCSAPKCSDNGFLRVGGALVSERPSQLHFAFGRTDADWELDFARVCIAAVRNPCCGVPTEQKTVGPQNYSKSEKESAGCWTY